MDELREKIIAVITLWSVDGSGVPDTLADRILAIPRIAEALRATEDGGELDVYRANCEWPN